MTHNSKDMEGIQQNIFTLIPSPWMNGAIFTSLKDGYTAIRWWILWSWFVFVQMVEVFSHSPLRLFYYAIVKSCFMSLLIHWLLPWDEVIEQSMFIATMRWGSTVVNGGKKSASYRTMFTLYHSSNKFPCRRVLWLFLICVLPNSSRADDHLVLWRLCVWLHDTLLHFQSASQITMLGSECLCKPSVQLLSRMHPCTLAQGMHHCTLAEALTSEGVLILVWKCL